MSVKISNVIERKLKFLKLTRAGKIRLNVFNDKVLYKGMDMLQQTHRDIPQHPFNTYYAYCVLEAQRLNLPPNWELISNSPNFDENGEVTENEEMFDMKMCNDIMNDHGKRRIPAALKKMDYNSSSTKEGPTFNRDFMYYKYGNWYKYPDQAISRDSRPCLPTSASQQDWLRQNAICPKEELRRHLDNLPEEQIALFPFYESPLLKEFLVEQETGRRNPTSFDETQGAFKHHDLDRLNLEPVEELKKAIESGKINEKGLHFLSGVYRKHKPEIYDLIQKYLNGEATASDSQHSLF